MNAAKWFATAFACILCTACEPARDEAGAIVGEGSLDAFSMQVGDCFNDTEALQSEDEISSVPATPCSEPHDNEVFAIYDVDLAEFPGQELMMERANEDCVAKFEAYVGRDYQSSELEVFAMAPSAESWVMRNDREVVCGLYHLESQKLTGSMQGSAR